MANNIDAELFAGLTVGKKTFPVATQPTQQQLVDGRDTSNDDLFAGLTVKGVQIPDVQPQIEPQQAVQQPQQLQQPVAQPALASQPQQLQQPQQGVINDITTVPVDISPDVDTNLQSGLVQPATQETTTIDEILGGLDTAKTIASSIIAEPVAGLVGLASIPFVGVDQAVKNINAVRDFISLEPSTDEGIRNLGVVGKLIEKGVDLGNLSAGGIVGIADILTGKGVEGAVRSIEEVRRDGFSTFLGERVFEATGDPALAAIAHSLPTAGAATRPVTTAATTGCSAS